MSWPRAGVPSWMHLTKREWICASRSIPAKICTTELHLKCFWSGAGNHPRCNVLFDPSHFVLQQLDYLEFLDLYHERIKMFHVKDAEFSVQQVARVSTVAISPG